MLSCKELTEQASNYLEKQLPLPKKLQIKMHLLICQHCRRYLKQIEITIDLVKRSSKTVSDEEAIRIVDKILKS